MRPPRRIPPHGAPGAAERAFPAARDVSLLARAGSFLRTVAVLHGGRQGAIADKVYLLVSGACDLEKSVVFARKRVGADGAQATERHSRVVPVSTLRVCPACRTANKQTNEQATNPRPQAESPLAGGAVPAPSLRAPPSGHSRRYV